MLSSLNPPHVSALRARMNFFFTREWMYLTVCTSAPICPHSCSCTMLSDDFWRFLPWRRFLWSHHWMQGTCLGLTIWNHFICVSKCLPNYILNPFLVWAPLNSIFFLHLQVEVLSRPHGSVPVNPVWLVTWQVWYELSSHKITRKTTKAEWYFVVSLLALVFMLTLQSNCIFPYAELVFPKSSIPATLHYLKKYWLYYYLWVSTVITHS